MKVLKYFTGFLLLIVASNCFANNDVKNDWWAGLNIEPKVAKLNGLTAEYLNESWVYASFLSYSDIRDLVSESDYQQLLNSKFSYSSAVRISPPSGACQFPSGSFRESRCNVPSTTTQLLPIVVLLNGF